MKVILMDFLTINYIHSPGLYHKAILYTCNLKWLTRSNGVYAHLVPLSMESLIIDMCYNNCNHIFCKKDCQCKNKHLIILPLLFLLQVTLIHTVLLFLSIFQVGSKNDINYYQNMYLWGYIYIMHVYATH